MLSSFPLVVEWMNFDVGEDKPGKLITGNSNMFYSYFLPQQTIGDVSFCNLLASVF